MDFENVNERYKNLDKYGHTYSKKFYDTFIERLNKDMKKVIRW